jgi:hypothetical protein
MSDEDLENCFAMFVTVGLVLKDGKHIDPDAVWSITRAVLDSRKKEEGIVSIKRSRKKVNEE